MIKRLFSTVLALAFLSAGLAVAQGDPIVYPAKGQSPTQTDKDKYECHAWAKQQTGFDPMQAQQAPPPGQESGHEVAKGAAVGAIGGLAIGSISGNAGTGAAIGAVGGGLIGGMKKRQKQEKQAQAQQQQSAEVAAGRNAYNRAFGACLEGRGYTVK